MNIIIALVPLFSLVTISLADYVIVYDYYNYGPKSLILGMAHIPWRFQYDPRNLKIYVTIRNKSANVTLHNVRYSTAHGTTKAEKMVIRGTEHYYVHGYFNTTRATIKLDLYKANVLCSSVTLAEGRLDWPATKLFLDISDYRAGVVLEVDLSDLCLENLTTMENDLDIDKYLPNFVPISLHDIVITETTTIKVTTNGTNTITTDHHHRNVIIIISVTIGVPLVLLLVFAIWKYYTQRLGKPIIPIIPPSEPFYLNMLFRQECDQEIAKVEQHQYVDIEEQQNEAADNYYEEINRH